MKEPGIEFLNSIGIIFADVSFFLPFMISSKEPAWFLNIENFMSGNNDKSPSIKPSSLLDALFLNNIYVFVSLFFAPPEPLAAPVACES